MSSINNSYNDDTFNPASPQNQQNLQNQNLNIPKVRNAAPATPRMLRNSSNSATLSDEYTINPDYINHQRTPSKRLPHQSPSYSRPNSQNQHDSNQNSLLPPLDLSGRLNIVTPPQNIPNQQPNTYSDNSNVPNRIQYQQEKERSPQRQQNNHHNQPHQQQPNDQPETIATEPSQQSHNTANQQFHRKSIGDWDFTKTIGAGSMGKVKLCKHRLTNEVCAVKVVTRAAKVWQRQHANDPPTNDQAELLQKKKEYEKEISRDKRTIREGALGKILYHPYICRMYEMFAMSNHYYMLFEYVSGGQMLDYIVAHGSLNENQARKFARGIASAIDYCHSNNIVHRDLKIENIMINNQGEIKIIDFGLSNMFTYNKLLKTYCGSLYFAAPELLSARPYRGPEVDIWSFGVILFVLVCGRVPFDDKSVSTLHEKIKKGQIDYPTNLSPGCIDLLKHMLVVDVGKRYNISDVILHPWLNKGYNQIVSNFLPSRSPLQLPLNNAILHEILSLNLGNDEDELRNELIDILTSDHYNRCVDNWYLKTRKQPFNPEMLDPTKAFHPLISIYFLVGEMLERKRIRISKQLSQNLPNNTQLPHNPIFNAASNQPNMVHQPSSRVVTQPIPQEYQHQHQKQSKPSPPQQVDELLDIDDKPSVKNEPKLSLNIPNIHSLQPPPAAHTSPHTDISPHSFNNSIHSRASPPLQQPNQVEESGMNSLFRKLSTNKNRDEMKRVGSVKVTTKEKQQQQQLSQLPSMSMSNNNTQSIRRNIPHHQRATSAYTTSIFNPEKTTPQRIEQTPPTSNVPPNRKYHPSARAKSVGHARKLSYGSNKTGTYTVDSDAPPLPQLVNINNEIDGFYDDDMDNIQFSNESNRSIKVSQKRPSDREIIEQFNKAPSNSMPSIEYPKTLFLKGFFSVQTTSTKPLPIIRYDMISVLPQLGVQFVEVKGGFICVHYPSIIDSKKPTNSANSSHRARSNSVSSAKSPNKSNNNSVNDEYIDTIDILKTPTISEASSSHLSRSRGSDEQYENTTFSTPSKFGHRRKFSLGSGILGSKKSDKLSLSTNVPTSNNDNLFIPTTPAPANLVRNMVDDSNESLTMDDTHGASDMLVSSRVEQQNYGGHSRTPSVTINTYDYEKKPSSRTPLKFEIHIVKVPLVGLYGIQFKKVSGNTWLYKSLASEILNRLNL